MAASSMWQECGKDAVQQTALAIWSPQAEISTQTATGTAIPTPTPALVPEPPPAPTLAPSPSPSPPPTPPTLPAQGEANLDILLNVKEEELEQEEKVEEKNVKPKEEEEYDSYVIYDCDIGVDDAWGLLLLIRAEEMLSRLNFAPKDGPGKFKILGVTCVQGNTDVHNVARNALRVLELIDRSDIPVFKGCAEPLLRRNWVRDSYFQGRDGLGDLEHETQVDESRICADHAAHAMYRFARAHPGAVDFVLVGPLTNFALCLNLYGEAFLMNVRNIFIMGGNCQGKGNFTKSAEFNFMMDPEAAYIVLTRSNKPIHILPWETCIAEDCSIPMQWRMDVVGTVQNRFVSLLNRAESAIFVKNGIPNWVACDAMLVAAYLFPKMIIGLANRYHVTVELCGLHTRGQMCIDHLHMQLPNAMVLMRISRVAYQHIIAWAVGLPGCDVESLLQL